MIQDNLNGQFFFCFFSSRLSFTRLIKIGQFLFKQFSLLSDLLKFKIKKEVKVLVWINFRYLNYQKETLKSWYKYKYIHLLKSWIKKMWLRRFYELAILFAPLLTLSSAGWTTFKYKSIKTISKNWQPMTSTASAK